jgi:hypothetical protein
VLVGYGVLVTYTNGVFVAVRVVVAGTFVTVGISVAVAGTPVGVAVC